MTDKPIFIIGAARSGTKFLRDCLRADSNVSAVPYDINYIWRYGQVNCADDALSPQSLNVEKIRYIRSSIEHQARLEAGQILLEKTVSNSLRVPFVEAVFPGARYVHLLRDGRDVALSAIKEWSAPPNYWRLLEKLRRMPFSSLPYLLWYLRNSVLNIPRASASHVKTWGPRYPGITSDITTRSLAEVCALQWKHSVETARTDLAKIPQNRVFTLKYEDLVSDSSVIAELATWLKLDSDLTKKTWHDTVVPKLNRSLTRDQELAIHEIECVLEKLLQSCGYSRRFCVD